MKGEQWNLLWRRQNETVLHSVNAIHWQFLRQVISTKCIFNLQFTYIYIYYIPHFNIHMLLTLKNNSCTSNPIKSLNHTQVMPKPKQWTRNAIVFQFTKTIHTISTVRLKPRNLLKQTDSFCMQKHFNSRLSRFSAVDYCLLMGLELVITNWWSSWCSSNTKGITILNRTLWQCLQWMWTLCQYVLLICSWCAVLYIMTD